MRFSLFVTLLVLSQSLSAQFGLSTFYNLNEARLTEVPQNVLPSDNKVDYPRTGELAAHYWFRLPTRRIEFQPTVYYAYPAETFAPSVSEFGFQFKTNVYLFDLATDCKCPTFGKQGPELQKGFFLQLSPGLSSHKFGDTRRQTVATVGAAIGLDVGVSNLLTLTPLVGVRRTLSVLDSPLVFTDENNVPIEGMKTHLTTIQLGLQATFRLDKRHY